MSTQDYSSPVSDSSAQKKRDIDFMQDISGTNAAGHTKAIVNLRWYEKNSDGTETQIREVQMQKPIVYIMKRAGYVNLFLDFKRRIDVDLKNCWDLISAYFNPVNSVSYTEDELESGVFNNGAGTMDRLVYFPLLEVRLSPIGRELEYIITGLNPASCSLAARDPSGEPCVLQMVFEESWFVVNSDLEQLDIREIEQEIIEEMKAGETLNLMN